MALFTYGIQFKISVCLSVIRGHLWSTSCSSPSFLSIAPFKAYNPSHPVVPWMCPNITQAKYSFQMAKPVHISFSTKREENVILDKHITISTKRWDISKPAQAFLNSGPLPKCDMPFLCGISPSQTNYPSSVIFLGDLSPSNMDNFQSHWECCLFCKHALLSSNSNAIICSGLCLPESLRVTCHFFYPKRKHKFVCTFGYTFKTDVFVMSFYDKQFFGLW